MLKRRDDFSFGELTLGGNFRRSDISRKKKTVFASRNVLFSLSATLLTILPDKRFAMDATDAKKG